MFKIDTKVMLTSAAMVAIDWLLDTDGEPGALFYLGLILATVWTLDRLERRGY